MKPTVIFTVCFLFLLFVVQAQQQEAVISKKGSKPVETPEANQVYVVEEVPVSDFYDGGGGYGQYFYYGDPTGMYLEEDWMDGKVDVKEGDDEEADLEGVDEPPVQGRRQEVGVVVEGAGGVEQEGQVADQVGDDEAHQQHSRQAVDHLFPHRRPGGRSE